MTTGDITQILYCFIGVGVLLLIGTILRAKVKIFQKLFLPASVIGGTIGLLLGPNVLPCESLSLFPREWMNVCSALPGLLSVIVVSAIPLTMRGDERSSSRTTTINAAKTWLIIVATFFLQILTGLATLAIFKDRFGLYDTFGYELISGYNGGHSTAGVLGSLLSDLGLPYWNLAQGVASTTATFGLVGGMALGIVYINIMVRQGKGAVLDKPAHLSGDMLHGIYTDSGKRPVSGYETTYNSTIESTSFHLGILLLCGGISYGILSLIKRLQIPVMKDFSVLTFCIFVMFAIWAVMKKLGIDSLIDKKTVSRISGTCADFAITAAMASMPIQAVLKYAVPILFMCVLGYVLTMAALYLLSKLSFKDYILERIVSMWGNCTGTYITGITLLKIADPEYKLPVMCEYSIGFAFTSPTSFILMSLSIHMMLSYSLGVNAAIQSAALAVTLIALILVNRLTCVRPGRTD